MDWRTFSDRLAEAIAAELVAQDEKLRDRVLRAIALDVHPWHGHIGLSALTDRDPAYESIVVQREEIASWGLFELARRGSCWARVRELEDWMGEQSVGKNPDAADYDHDAEPRTAAQQAVADHAALEASARALDDERVTEALSRFRLAPDFERFVGHPDDSSQTNLCRGRS